MGIGCVNGRTKKKMIPSSERKVSQKNPFHGCRRSPLGFKVDEWFRKSWPPLTPRFDCSKFNKIIII